MVNNSLLLILFVNFSICSSTLLWRIGTSPPAYIFGSIHVPHNLIWPYVSNETRQAFQSSTHFYAEVDAKSDAYWDDFFQCIVDRSNRTRRSSNRPTYIKDMLDVYLIEEARRLNKTVGSLERPEAHCEREGYRFNLTVWKLLIDIVKKEMKNGTVDLNGISTDLVKPIIKKYICDEITGRYIQSLYPSRNDMLQVQQRDGEISKYIHSLLQRSKNDRYFFAVGVGHMVGKHRNLKIRLEEFGYKIRRVCTDRKRIKKKFGCKKQKTPKYCLKKIIKKYFSE